MRLFVGLTIPSDVRETLVTAWDKVTDAPQGFRFVHQQHWHLTLTFLGEVERRRLPHLRLLLDRATTQPPKASLTFRGFQTFPSKHPTYVVAKADADDQEWKDFVERMRDLLSMMAPQLDRKPWHPHVTLGRARRGVSLSQWEHPIPPLTWTPHQITLVKSELTPTGSIYSDLHVLPLNL